MELIKLAERHIASYIGVKHALLTSMGRTALVIALKALGVGPGKSVIVPSFTCEVVVNAVKYCGAEPVFADVDPHTFNIDPEQIEAKTSRNTQAVIFIHCYGQPADVKEILEVAQKNDLFVIEDAAHSFGAEYHGSKVGVFGDVSIFSFTKNMDCSSGGALATDSDDLILKARNILKKFDTRENLVDRLRYATERRFVSFTRKERRFFASSRVINISRIDIVRKLMSQVSNKIPKVFEANDQIAAEVIEGLRTIDRNNKERRRRARNLTEIIGQYKIDGIQPPVEKEDRKHIYYLYALRVAKRKRLTKRLEKIERAVYWGLPWQCFYGRIARELSQQLVLLETNKDLSEEAYSLLISVLSSL
jgi:dTDP-4-amino-4,6-dideoxygalactose transaminase